MKEFTMSSATHTRTYPCPSHSRKSIALGAVQILLAAFFLAAAVPKITGQNGTVHMFADIGVGQWLRYLVGAAEVAGAVGLLVPRLAALAALGLAVDMAGASVINVAVLHSSAVVLTIALCVVMTLLAGSRWSAIGRFGRRGSGMFRAASAAGESVGSPAHRL
jgi:putative oxidoreductase